MLKNELNFYLKNFLYINHVYKIYIKIKRIYLINMKNYFII